MLQAEFMNCWRVHICIFEFWILCLQSDIFWLLESWSLEFWNLQVLNILNSIFTISKTIIKRLQQASGVVKFEIEFLSSKHCGCTFRSWGFCKELARAHADKHLIVDENLRAWAGLVFQVSGAPENALKITNLGSMRIRKYEEEFSKARRIIWRIV